MKAIASWIMSVLVDKLKDGFGSKFAVTAVLIGLQISIFAVAIAAIAGVTSGISMAVNDDLQRAMSWFVPSNTLPCMGAAFSAYIIRFTLEYHSTFVRLWAQSL